MTQDDPIVEEFAPTLTRANEQDLPPHIVDINRRHVEALYRFITTMRAAGIDDDVVRHSVREIVSSYERELVDALTGPVAVWCRSFGSMMCSKGDPNSSIQPIIPTSPNG